MRLSWSACCANSAGFMPEAEEDAAAPGLHSVAQMPSEEPKVADDFVTGRGRTTALIFAAAVMERMDEQ